MVWRKHLYSGIYYEKYYSVGGGGGGLCEMAAWEKIRNEDLGKKRKKGKGKRKKEKGRKLHKKTG